MARTTWHTRTYDVSVFARRLRASLDHPDQRVVWFLGAGCSMSSGIPAAGALVRSWLPRIAALERGTSDGWEDFADERYPGWRDGPGQHYGQAMHELFDSARDRQREIERLTLHSDPGLGYAVLAQLAGHAEVGQRVNVVLTTNFDDLVADAMYLYTRLKPLVVGHDALARFARRNAARPLVVKVHGDAHLEPRNTPQETSAVSDDMAERLQGILHDASVVFLGYAGADESVAKVIATAEPAVVTWVGRDEPAPALADAVRRVRDVAWVHHLDFDEVMIELHRCFGLGRPDFERFAELEDRWLTGVRKVRDAGEAAADGSGARDHSDGLLQEHDAWSLARRASQEADRDPGRAEQLYEQALANDEHDAGILGNYALFLAHIGEEHRAREMYDRALEVQPDHANNLGNYANFLLRAGDRDGARRMYERSIAADPVHAGHLGNYANFLSREIGEDDLAHEIYERAVATDPEHANNLGNYALFVSRDGGRRELARAMYERATGADPSHANNLCNYAMLLSDEPAERDRARDLFERALAAEPEHANALNGYANFLTDVLGEHDRAEEMYERAVAAAPNSPMQLRNFAIFLREVRGDVDRAQQLLDDAVAADPGYALALTSLASLLSDERGEHEQARELHERAVEADPDDVAVVGAYANFLTDVLGDHDRAEEMYERALDAGPDNAVTMRNFAIFLEEVRGDAERADELRLRAELGEG